LAQGITFEHGNFAAVCAKAKAEKKLVFIDVYTSWCGPCKYMAATVFKKDNVGQYFNSQFINFKIDAEKGEGKALAAKYKVQFYPTYLFIDDKGPFLIKLLATSKIRSSWILPQRPARNLPIPTACHVCRLSMPPGKRYRFPAPVHRQTDDQ
jgi:thiol-disulfide isomerase/thioredoxin